MSQLKKTIDSVWNHEISQEIIEKLISSILARCEILMEVRRLLTKY